MKKILSLLAAMSPVLCAHASDLTFEVEVHYNLVTVTPSVDDELYYCAAVDEEAISIFTEITGQEPATPEELFGIASMFYTDFLFTGVSTLTCHGGNLTLLICGAEQNQYGMILPTTEITALPITINTDNDIPEVEPLTFTIESDNDGFYVIPSDDEQEYAIGVFPLYMIEGLAEINRTAESYMAMLANFGHLFGYTSQGTSYHVLEEYAEEGDVIADGLYIIAVVGVRADVNRHVLTSPVYSYDWLIDHNTTGVNDIQIAVRSAKMLKDGKFILDGRVLLDGTLVR